MKVLPYPNKGKLVTTLFASLLSYLFHVGLVVYELFCKIVLTRDFVHILVGVRHNCHFAHFFFFRKGNSALRSILLHKLCRKRSSANSRRNRKLPKIGDEENKKAVSATKRIPRSEINLHSVTPGNFIFTLEIENKVLKSLHFKTCKKDTSAFARKLLSVYRKTL